MIFNPNTATHHPAPAPLLLTYQPLACTKCGGLWSHHSDGYGGRQSYCPTCGQEANTKSNPGRMWVDGKYMPKGHPLHKPGRYKTLNEAFSHTEIDKVKEGYVYMVTNPAFPGWIKVGTAVNTRDRLSGFQTSDPHREYKMVFTVKVANRFPAEAAAHRRLARLSHGRKGEWFKTSRVLAKHVLRTLSERETT